jgi:hypothetical protein
MNCCCSGVGLLPGLFTSIARNRPVFGMQPIMSETPRVWVGKIFCFVLSARVFYEP